MTPKERAAMQQALEACEAGKKIAKLMAQLSAKLGHGDLAAEFLEDGIFERTDAALREALDHSGEANEMVEFFSKEMKNKISVARAEQAEQEPSCNPHPDAPHGFDRNASHNAHRYVCECEGWEPEQADGEQWSPDDMAYRPGGLSMEQAEHEPVAWHHPQCDGQCIACLIEKAVQDAYGTQGRDYMLRHINAAAYVRTKDLTDDEIDGIDCEYELDDYGLRDFARAVIAADREKNK